MPDNYKEPAIPWKVIGTNQYANSMIDIGQKFIKFREKYCIATNIIAYLDEFDEKVSQWLQTSRESDLKNEYSETSEVRSFSTSYELFLCIKIRYHVAEKLIVKQEILGELRHL